MTFIAEECWTLVGARRGRIWAARRMQRAAGERSQVAFDGAWALAREEQRRDVVGFYHTHPPGLLRLSARDVRTMRAWCGAFGKPLVCVIESSGEVAGWVFTDDDSDGVQLNVVETFPRYLVIGVQSHGRKVRSRGAVPRGGRRGAARQGPARAVRGRGPGVASSG